MLLLSDFKSYLSSKNLKFQSIGVNKILFDLKVTGPSGNRESFSLEVSETNNFLYVRETCNKLPTLCPNRHLNTGGSFCLGLREDLIHLSAEEWFLLIKDFLKIQISVSKNKFWPKIYPQWSHGEDAAKYQKIVENNLRVIDLKKLGFDLNKLYLIKKDNKAFPNSEYYFLYHKSELVLMSFKDKVHNKRASCICNNAGKKSHSTIGKCKNKCAKLLFDTVYYEEKRKFAEKEFWDFFKNQNAKCCNTMKECGLK